MVYLDANTHNFQVNAKSIDIKFIERKDAQENSKKERLSYVKNQ